MIQPITVAIVYGSLDSKIERGDKSNSDGGVL
jgi:hypothetical protein